MVAASPKQAGKLRIIGGQWRGRKLPIAKVEGLRPTGDRIRETLFNWLQADIYGATCLDLFAGSGALGFEALSRGAASVDFVERDSKAAKQLRENCAALSASARIHQLDAASFLDAAIGVTDNSRYSLVFVDPPFAANAWTTCLLALEQKQLLTKDALIYIESPADTQPSVPANWQGLKSKTSGRVQFALYQRPA